MADIRLIPLDHVTYIHNYEGFSFSCNIKCEGTILWLSLQKQIRTIITITVICYWTAIMVQTSENSMLPEITFSFSYETWIGRQFYYTLSHFENDRDITSARIPEEDACHRARNLCVSHAFKRAQWRHRRSLDETKYGVIKLKIRHINISMSRIYQMIFTQLTWFG